MTATQGNSIKSKIIVWKRPTQAMGMRVLDLFAHGIRKHGESVEIRDPLTFAARQIREADIHIIWNTFFNHSNLILAAAKQVGKPLIVVEGGFVCRDFDNLQRGHWSVGYNGIKGYGEYSNADSPPDRWDELGLKLFEWNRDTCTEEELAKKHILLAAQMTGDISMDGILPNDWLRDALERIEPYAKHPIRIRLNPKDNRKKTLDKWRAPHEYSPVERTIEEDLADAFCMVTYSSNSVVDALIAGVPVFHNGRSIAGSMAKTELEEIEMPLYAVEEERQRWANGLAYAQWSGAELFSGEGWEHVRSPYVSNAMPWL